MYGHQLNFKMSFYTLSDQYFAAARAARLHEGMTGFHARASDKNCFKHGKHKKGKKKKKKGHMDDLLAAVGSGRVKGGCGSCSKSPWIAHAKEYQHKHGCIYTTALSEASKTYHK